jgi:RIO kinase 1
MNLPGRKGIEEEADSHERQYEEESLMLEKNRETFQVLEEVFDRLTIQAVNRLYKRGIIAEIYGAVNAGKEARIYWGTNNDGSELAIKIYYTKTADFRRGMMRYIEGDPRFSKIRRSPRSIVYAWAQKEFKNLQLIFEAGIICPKPIDFYRNIVVMTFIGEDGVPAPLLKDVELTQPSEFYNELVTQMKLMYSNAKLVHGDLSSYNVMVWKNHPVIFDVSQAMLVSHPISDELVSRDVNNINRFFKGLGVEIYDTEIMEAWIKGGEEDLY